MKTFDGNMNPKSSLTLRDRDASFSTIRPVQFTALDHDSSTLDLGVFSAHKYFNEVTNISSYSKISPLHNMNMEHQHNPERGCDTTKTHKSNYRAHSFHATTPIAASSSDANSHSQACFVSHPPTNEVSSSTTRNPSHPHIPTNPKTKFRASLSKPIRLLQRKCPCSCSCRESVQVSETTLKPKPTITPPPLPLPSSDARPQPQPPTSQNPKTPTTKTNKLEQDPTTSNEILNSQEPRIGKVTRLITEGFTFPALSTASHGKNQVLHVVHEEELPRYYLEVFQPTVDRDRRQNFPSPPTPKSRALDDDTASDGSSDLFEIESFSTQVTTITCPIVVPTKTECHQPSVVLSSTEEMRSSIVSGSECVVATTERHLTGATTSTTIAV